MDFEVWIAKLKIVINVISIGKNDACLYACLLARIFLFAITVATMCLVVSTNLQKKFFENLDKSKNICSPRRYMAKLPNAKGHRVQTTRFLTDSFWPVGDVQNWRWGRLN